MRSGREKMCWSIAMRIKISVFPSQPVSAFLAVLVLGCQLVAQDPPQSLKQADADYREGVAALNRNDLRTAQAKFEEVVRLAPTAEQGHSALGAVLEREGQMAAA